MPTALVTGSPDRVSDISIALKTAGFDLVGAGPLPPDGVLDIDERSVDYVVLVTGEEEARRGIAAFARPRPRDPQPWWSYADVDPDLPFADWRESILCLASLPQP